MGDYEPVHSSLEVRHSESKLTHLLKSIFLFDANATPRWIEGLAMRGARDLGLKVLPGMAFIRAEQKKSDPYVRKTYRIVFFNTPEIVVQSCSKCGYATSEGFPMTDG